MSTIIPPLPSSYRDPSGFIFRENGILYRQVNLVYKEHFDHFITSGFYETLVKKDLLLSHEQVNDIHAKDQTWYTTLKPVPVPVISYPYEWSFEMLKDAALLTLRLVKEGLAYGMILKDATPYNIQWYKGRLIFIDSLSFEKYNEEEPWVAYRQFCEHFLSPILLMHYSGHSLERLLLAYPEGIPLPITSSLLPRKTKFSLHIYLHIHLHANMQQKARAGKKIKFTKQKLLNIISSLETLVSKLKLPTRDTAWSSYYSEASERDDYLEVKKQVISKWLEQVSPASVADLGANDGEFSQLTAARGITTLAADMDPYCIDRLYKKIRAEKQGHIQPMVIDLSDPSPAMGVNNQEREPFIKRGRADLVLALALVHHLAIGKNIPLSIVADLFNQVCARYLIIEFIPRSDEKIQLMLTGRKDIFTGYDQQQFEYAFGIYFKIKEQSPIGGSGRILYLMTKHEG